MIFWEDIYLISQINDTFATYIILLKNNFYWFRLLNKPKLQK
jgi:hypothetical protein